MTLRQHLPALARALMDAVSEHGQPNSFGPGELHHEHGAPRPLVQGRIGRDMWLLVALAGELGKIGWTGTMPVYRRRWIV